MCVNHTSPTIDILCCVSNWTKLQIITTMILIIYIYVYNHNSYDIYCQSFIIIMYNRMIMYVTDPVNEGLVIVLFSSGMKLGA